jgi:hypothetical protein
MTRVRIMGLADNRRAAKSRKRSNFTAKASPPNPTGAHGQAGEGKASWGREVDSAIKLAMGDLQR